ncbi:MAG: hypothetical protein NZ908_00645 [Candidatus Micrarchaeota archaeon]|nr:hypothetical protein [Candidatus Micrarchaeota archaeon]MCX8154471.1 hypothetical protein [Candidatus Micrarchaeota archaeon]
MISTHIEELDYIMDGGIKEGSSIFVKFPSTTYDGFISMSMMGRDTFNVIVLFRESWNSLENKLKRTRVPYRVDLIIDAFSRSNRISYEDDRVIFIDSPSLLNDISYEYNSALNRINKSVFLNILTSDSGLEKNEMNSFVKFIEVMQTRTINRGVFMMCGETDLLRNRDLVFEISIKNDEHIMRSKQIVSEIFFKTEPVFKIL